MNTINSDAITIADYADAHADDFARLNREWLVSFDLLDPADLPYIDAPRENILDPGGCIVVALLNGRVVGTCAVIPVDHHTVELAKLAVEPGLRGHGLGRRLTEAAIERARKMGATRIELVSNNRLDAAVKLYESLGFRHTPAPANLKYANANVFMELPLR